MLPPFLRRILTVFFAVLTSGFFAAVLFIILLHNREVELPAWAEKFVSNQIDASLSDLNVRFETAYITLDQSWQPSFGFKDIKITSSKAPGPVLLNRMAINLSLARALEGRFRISTVQVDGVFITLFRDQSGAVTAQFGDFDSQFEKIPTASDLIATVDTFLLQQALSSFHSLDARGITLEYVDRRSNRRWAVDGARFNIKKTDDKLIARADMALLTGGADVATLETSFEHVIGQNESLFGLSFVDMPAEIISSQLPALAWMGALRAPISGALRGGFDNSGSLRQINASVQISNGALQPSSESRAILFDSASAYFTYDTHKALLNFDDVAISSRDLSLSAQGYAILEPNDDWPTGLFGQFEFYDIRVNPDGQLDAPVTLNHGTMDFRLLLEPFELQVKQFFAEDTSRDVAVSGAAILNADEQGWSVNVDAEASRATSNDVLAYWPPNFKPKSRNWVKQNVKTAVLKDIRYSMRLKEGEPPRTDLGYSYQNAEIRVLKTLPSIKNGSGQFSLANNRLATKLTTATFVPQSGETVDLSGSYFVIPDVRIKPAPAVAEIRATGSVTSALTTLNYPPMKALDRLDFATDSVGGQAEIKAIIEFPVMRGAPPEQIRYTASAVINNAISDQIVPNQTLSAKVVNVQVDNDALQIDALAEMRGISFDTAFRMAMGENAAKTPAILNSKLQLSMDLIEAFSIPLPEGLLNGSSPADLTVEFNKDADPEFFVSSDLFGSTLSIDRLNWRKPKMSQAQFELTGTLSQNIKVNRFALRGAGLVMDAVVEIDAQNQFEALTFSKFAISDQLNVSGMLDANGDIKISGGTLNLPEFLDSEAETLNTPTTEFDLDVALDTMKISKNNALHQFKGKFTNGATLAGEFRANLNERAPFGGEVRPNNGNIRIKAGSNDAGQFLMALDVLERAQGGRLLLTLDQRDTAGEMDGVLRVTDIKLQKMPLLAELLNAMSIVGLLDQLTGPGVIMNEIDAVFRITDDQIIVQSASALGPSMGITLDGYYNLESKTFDMQGFFSPLYLVNGIGSILSRKGEGFFGFGFNLEGTTDRPRFIINPLSAITPTILRDLFRRPPPKLE